VNARNVMEQDGINMTIIILRSVQLAVSMMVVGGKYLKCMLVTRKVRTMPAVS